MLFFRLTAQPFALYKRHERNDVLLSELDVINAVGLFTILSQMHLFNKSHETMVLGGLDVDLAALSLVSVRKRMCFMTWPNTYRCFLLVILPVFRLEACAGRLELEDGSACPNVQGLSLAQSQLGSQINTCVAYVGVVYMKMTIFCQCRGPVLEQKAGQPERRKIEKHSENKLRILRNIFLANQNHFSPIEVLSLREQQ